MPGLDPMRLQADHNTWMNRRLNAMSAGMTDEERKRDLGAFCRSIHGTFNHVLLADRVWLSELSGEPFAITSLSQALYADYDELREGRENTDANAVK